MLQLLPPSTLTLTRGFSNREWIGLTNREKPYENALAVELGLRGIACQRQSRFDLVYKAPKWASIFRI
jgi:PD-(D/E)XK nuclease superfamily protein